MDIDEKDVSFQEAEIDGHMFATREQIESFAKEGKFLHYDSIKQVFSFDWKSLRWKLHLNYGSGGDVYR